MWERIFSLIGRKIVVRPLIPVAGSWIDATPFLLIFLFLSLSALFLLKFGREERGRWGLRIASAFFFIIFLHRCLCMIRDAMLGISEIGRDDLRAFGQLCIFIPVIGFSLSIGRAFCGWVCPLGLLQEGAGRIALLKRRVLGYGKAARIFDLILLALISFSAFRMLVFFKPSTDFFTENVAACFSIFLLCLLPFALVSKRWAERLVKVRYPLLGVWILLVFVRVFVTNPWCVLYGGELDYSSLLALFVVLSVSLLIPMAWCRYICPLGTLLSLTSRFSALKFRSGGKCKRCGRCDEVCPVGAIEEGKLNLSSCIYCGRCLKGCVGRIEMR